jgi:hypothetical protein
VAVSSPKQVRAPVWQAGDHEQQRVAIAVGARGVHAQAVAGGFALHPQRPAAAAPEVREPRLLRAQERLRVRVRDHQHVAGRTVLRDHGQEAARVEDEPVGQRRGHAVTSRTSTSEARSSALA